MTNYEKSTNCIYKYSSLKDSCDTDKSIYSEPPFKLHLTRASFDQNLLQNFKDLTQGKIVENFEKCICSGNKQVTQFSEEVQKNYLSGLITENSNLTKIK